MVGLAHLGLRDRLDRLAPAPAGLEDRAADADIAHVVRLETAVRDLADIVRLTERPPLKLHHRHRTIAPSPPLTQLAWPFPGIRQVQLAAQQRAGVDGPEFH